MRGKMGYGDSSSGETRLHFLSEGRKQKKPPVFALVAATCHRHVAIGTFESLPGIKEEGAMAPSSFMGLMIIMDTIYGDSLTNAPLLRNLHPKALGCTLASIFAPSTDKVYPRSTNDPWGNS